MCCACHLNIHSCTLCLFFNRGVFEFEKFNKGTFGIVNILADITKNNGAVTIIGGGDSVAATEQSGRASDMSHISTGGGASLELLEGKELPGVVALDDK